MSSNLFVYGTLCAPEIVHALLKRAPVQAEGSVVGYKRQCIKQQVFPAIVPSSPSDCLKGRVLTGLSYEELCILDDYEDDDYYRTSIKATLADGDTLECGLYVWKEDKRDMLLNSDWDYAGFRAQHLDSYLAMVHEFVSET